MYLWRYPQGIPSCRTGDTTGVIAVVSHGSPGRPETSAVRMNEDLYVMVDEGVLEGLTTKVVTTRKGGERG